MRISNRLSRIPISSIRQFDYYAEMAEKEGVKILRLNSGQPDIETPEEFFEPIRKFKGTLKYSRSQGIEELLESFSNYYEKNNIDFKSDDMVITNGGTQAIFFVLMITCDEYDEILVPEPFYTNYKVFASMLDINIVPIETSYDNKYSLPEYSEMESLITNKTRAILFSNPGNPTGIVYSEDDMKKIVDLAENHNLYIISDEVYREFVYDNIKFKSFASIEKIKNRLILLDSISKRYSACGARIGVIASKNKEIISQAVKLSQSFVGSPQLEQIGASNLMKIDDSFLEQSKNIYEKRRDLIYERLNRIEGIECFKPTGAFYIAAKLPVKDSSEFAKWLLTDFRDNNETILITPMSGFYNSSSKGLNEIRIAYPKEESLLLRFCDILEKALDEYKN